MPDDLYDLERFVRAQASSYSQALAELTRGQKESHWMWFIFPQIAGLGTSAMSQRFAIRNVDEAGAYLEHPVLGARLRECMQTLLDIESRTAHAIFGSPDDLKLQSCATLFAQVSPRDGIFERVLQKFFDGHRDEMTMRFLRAQSEA